MKNPPEDQSDGPEPDGGTPLRYRDTYHRHRWLAVLISFMAVIGLLGYLLALNWQRGDTTQDQVDAVRLPLCRLMLVVLSRPPETLSPESQAALDFYREMYGPGTAEQQGLNCPFPIPQPAEQPG